MRRKSLIGAAAAALTALTALATVATRPVLAQRGDIKGEVVREVWRDMEVPPAPVVPPEKALATFSIAPGFRLELVAAEPLVEDPVAISWDADGRLWAVEMRGFMPNVDGEGEEAKNGRIVVLEDDDGDGRMDRSTVFMDGLALPRAVGLVKGGALVAEPPRLWYCGDTDGDLKCDERRELTRYGYPDLVEGSENGLVLSLDNWIHNAGSDRRFRWRAGALVTEPDLPRGQWGIEQDDYGRLYYNDSVTWLMLDVLPWSVMGRNPDYPTKVGLRRVAIEDQSTWSVRVNPGVNRGYAHTSLRPDGRLKITTSVSGLAVYRGDQFPGEYLGDVFVPEPAANLVAHFRCADEGLEVRCQQQLSKDERWGERAFLASTDERFRPVEAAIGPDGCLYIVDMYRGILQHKQFMTSYLRKQILERGLDKPVGLGRIYRVVSQAAEPGSTRPALGAKTTRELVALLEHPNGWQRDTAQRLLLEREDVAALPALRGLAAIGRTPLGRIHALWTLEGLGGIDAASVLAGLSFREPQVQIAAARVAGGLLAPKPEPHVVARLIAIAGAPGDLGARVAAAAALTYAADDAGAAALLSELLARPSTDESLRAALLAGLGGRELGFIRRLLARPVGPAAASFEASLRELAGIIARRRRAEELGELTALAAEQREASAWRGRALLAGLAAVAARAEPLPLAEKPAAWAALAGSKDSETAALAASLEPLMAWASPPAAANGAQPAQPAQPAKPTHSRALADGRLLYMAACMPCHQSDGAGLPDRAPPLAGSDWVKGDPELMARIVLHGLTGPIKVAGQEWNSEMPGFGTSPLFSDDVIASLLSYLRGAWGNRGAAVEPGSIEVVRRLTRTRSEPWTAAELSKLEKK